MKLAKIHAAKIDKRLRETLLEAEGNEVVRAVMVLGQLNDERHSEPAPPEPTQFSSRTDYRRALIESRQVEVGKIIGKTRQKLSELSLNPRGGKVGQTVVVEGSAERILASLELPGVRHASLDQRVGLVTPDRGKRTPRKVRIPDVF